MSNDSLEFLDVAGISPTYLSKEFGLIKPDYANSVAGTLPESIKLWHADFELEESSQLVINKSIASKLEESYPSGYSKIVFVIADAIGVYHLSKMKGLLWDNISSSGTMASSCFPTMTATVMTSLAYGLRPSQHGVVGYNFYNEHVSQIWNALSLQYQNILPEHQSVLDKVELSQLVSGKAISQQVQQSSLPINFLVPHTLQPPGLGNILNPTLDQETYEAIPEALNLVSQYLKTNTTGITALYLPHADYAAHQYGPESKQYVEAIRMVEHVIQAITSSPDGGSEDTLVLLTSDHGQAQIDHSISKWMTSRVRDEYAKDGIALSTSGRVIHAYSEASKIDETRLLLDELVGGNGVVIDNSQAIELAGHDTKYAHRLGELLAVYSDGYLYDIPEVGTIGQSYPLYGQHGSLTAKELFVPVGIF